MFSVRGTCALQLLRALTRDPEDCSRIGLTQPTTGAQLVDHTAPQSSCFFEGCPAGSVQLASPSEICVHIIRKRRNHLDVNIGLVDIQPQDHETSSLIRDLSGRPSLDRRDDPMVPTT